MSSNICLCFDTEIWDNISYCSHNYCCNNSNNDEYWVLASKIPPMSEEERCHADCCGAMGHLLLS
jgi:hypothetical protein